MAHVEDFITDQTRTDPNEVYARWLFTYFRLPAYMLSMLWPMMRDHKLFCTYDGKRYRVTGASRLGDVWITKNFDKDVGYDMRVLVDECSEWGPFEEPGRTIIDELTPYHADNTNASAITTQVVCAACSTPIKERGVANMSSGNVYCSLKCARETEEPPT